MVEDIAAAGSPEEAAGLGRRAERQRPALVRQDWPTAKLAVMYAGLRAKVRRALPSCGPVGTVRLSTCQQLYPHSRVMNPCQNRGFSGTRPVRVHGGAVSSEERAACTPGAVHLSGRAL